jgi:chromosome segregation ATPase
MQGNEKTLGDVIGEALRPRTVLDALRESIRELDAEIDEERARLLDLEARRYDLVADEDRIRGDLLAMEWHKAEAEAKRSRTPEAAEAASHTFVRYMAAMHLRNGTVPGPGEYAASIEAAMDELSRSVQ